MTRAFVHTLALVLFCICDCPCFAQTQIGAEQGILPYGSYHGGDVDSVNLKNGNLTVRIPLFSLPQKGKLALSFSLVLNNQGFIQSQFCDPASVEDGQCYTQYVRSGPVGPNLVMDQAINIIGNISPDNGEYCVVGFFENYCSGDVLFGAPNVSVTDSTGAAHALLYDSDNWSLMHAEDGSGYSYQTPFTQADFTTYPYEPFFGPEPDPNFNSSQCTFPYFGGYSVGTIYTPTGISHTFQDTCVASAEDPVSSVEGTPTYPIAMQDRSGNTITYTLWSGEDGSTYPGAISDSVGRTIPDFFKLAYDTTVSPRCPNLGVSNQPASYSKTWIVPGPGANSGQAAYTFCMTTVTYNTLFGGGLPAILETQGLEYYEPQAIGGSIAIQSVVLPNGTYWGFVYDSAGQIVINSDLDMADPTATTVAYANLTKLLYPTGGSTSYTYEQQPACTTFWEYNDFVNTRSVNDNNGNNGLWTYGYSGTTGVALNGDGTATTVPTITTITDPGSNDTVHTFQNPVSAAYGCTYMLDGNIQQFSGPQAQGHILKTTVQSFANTTVVGDDGVFFAANDQPTSSSESLSGGSSVSKTYSYPPLTTLVRPICNRQLTSDPSHPYNCVVSVGTGPIAINYNEPGNVAVALSDGTLSSSTTTTFKYQNSSTYLSANLLSDVASTQTEDVLNQSLANQTTYGYDEANGSPQGLYGNQTSVTRWINTGGQSQTSTVYNSAGMPITETDADGNNTYITYQCSGALPYQITNALGEMTTYGYDCNTGQVTGIQNPNDEAADRSGTTYSYSTTGDLKSISYPDGGSVSISYNGYSIPLHVTTTTTASPTSSLVSDLYYDGLARPITTTTSGMRTDTVYDSLGRIHSVSNPYQTTSDTTYGLTVYGYDGLNRLSTTTHLPDGSLKQSIYNGDVTTFTDENGNSWQRTSDALGRLKQVVELGSLSTDYSYDVLNNLLSVNQVGHGGGDMPRTRYFQYDSLSRLTAACNPESLPGETLCDGVNNWSISYAYDANNNVHSKTDARGVITTYNYDSLNRLLSKYYSGNVSPGSLSSCFQYDNAVNGIGKLAAEWIQAGTCASSLPSSAQSSRLFGTYDPMGRPVSERQCAAGYCTSASLPSAPTPNCVGLSAAIGLQYCYDLAGNLLAYSNGVTTATAATYPQQAILFSQSFDGAGRLASVASSWSDPTHPSPIFSNATYTAGRLLSSWLLGANLWTSRQYDARLRVCNQQSAQQQSPAPPCQ